MLPHVLTHSAMLPSQQWAGPLVNGTLLLVGTAHSPIALVSVACATGRVQLGPARQDSPRRASFGLLATRRVGFSPAQLDSRLIGDLPITRQASYHTPWHFAIVTPVGLYSLPLSYIFILLPLCSHPLGSSICHAISLPVTDHFHLSRIIFTCHGLSAPLV